MEEEQTGLLHRIHPPRLEDAGLEDCALPPESIKEAFLKAASEVKSRAASIFTSDDDDDNGAGVEGDCINDQWPTIPTDAVVATSRERDLPAACEIEKGRVAPAVGKDEVVVGGGEVDIKDRGDKVVVGGDELNEGGKGKACVDGMQGLEIGDKGKKKKKMKNGDDDEEDKEEEKEGDRPILAEVLSFA